MNNKTILITGGTTGIGLATARIDAAATAAVGPLGHTLAVEPAPRVIRVNTLSPGPIQTPNYGKLGLPADAQQGFEDHLAARSLFQRFGTVDEVDRLARFLLSLDSSFIIGENITIDDGGGRT